jgi:F-type H+-transporting ATPase subunit b
MSNGLIERLRLLPEQQKQALVTAAAGTAAAGGDPKSVPPAVVLVRSAYVPTPAGRTELETAIRECLGVNCVVRFETAPELVGGLELLMGAVKLPWSVADYLSTLAEDAAALAAELTGPSSAPQLPAPEVAAHAH